jgi:hypothetical protein
MASSTDCVTLEAMMGVPTRGRWAVQLRLGVDPQTEFPEVWGTLGAEDRAVVIERLAEAMVNMVVATATGQGGENAHENIEGGEQAGGDITRIA